MWRRSPSSRLVCGARRRPRCVTVILTSEEQRSACALRVPLEHDSETISKRWAVRWVSNPIVSSHRRIWTRTHDILMLDRPRRRGSGQRLRTASRSGSWDRRSCITVRRSLLEHRLSVTVPDPILLNGGEACRPVVRSTCVPDPFREAGIERVRDDELVTAHGNRL
jgi:hypothetical protein